MIVFAYLVDRRFLVANPDDGPSELGRKVRFGAQVRVEPHFFKSAPEKVPVVLFTAGEDPDADGNLLSGAPFKLDRGLCLPENLLVCVLEDASELVWCTVHLYA